MTIDLLKMFDDLVSLADDHPTTGVRHTKEGRQKLVALISQRDALVEAIRLYRIELQKPCGAGDYAIALDRLESAMSACEETP